MLLEAEKPLVYYSPHIIQTAEASEKIEQKQEEPKKKELAEVSAYTASEDETDASPDIMASGKKVYNGALACPSRYKFGTKIELEGYGVYTCEDRMNARYRDKNNFDVYLQTKEEAKKFGRKKIAFQVID
jgi:3D (Asp-Asp-Asp) domain-containing protein